MMAAGTLAWTGAEMQRVSALMAEGKSAREIGEVIGRDRKAVLAQARKHKLGSWKSATGYKAADRSHIPADFAERWETTSQANLCAHYRKAAGTINHWCKKLGLVRIQGKKMTPAAPATIKPAPPKLQPYHKSAMTPQRDMTRAGMAADWLRQFGPVVRCNAEGRYDPKGDHWRRGSTVLTAEEIVERANRNGWKPDAWKSLPPRMADAA